jgi:ferredoxin/DMSO/TMAO reductase YedYZ heme-binding membrane subunit
VGSQSQDLHLVLASFGFESLALLWLSVLTGILLRGSWRPSLLSQPALQEIHQATAVLGLSLGAAHGIGQLVLPRGSTTVMERHVPLAGWDHRIGTGLAIVGSGVLAAVALSVILKRWLGPARWRALHLSSYAAFTLIVAHVLISGPDVAPAWARLPIVAGWLATVAFWLATTSWLRTPQPAQPPRKRAVMWVAERLPEGGDSSADATVLVDNRLCTRSGLCEQLAPHVFRLGVDGAVFHRSTVPAAELELATRAAEICPVRAITLTGRPSLPSASPVPIDAPRHSDISAVPGVRRRPAVSRGDR